MVTFGFFAFSGSLDRYSRAPSPYYTDSHRRLAEFMRTYVASELSPWAQEWEDAEKIPRRVRTLSGKLLRQVFKRHAEIGCIAAALVPKQKLRPYIGKTNVTLPANISIEEWNSFHDFIVAFRRRMWLIAVRRRTYTARIPRSSMGFGKR
jgi:hypothetical protein